MVLEHMSAYVNVFPFYFWVMVPCSAWFNDCRMFAMHTVALSFCWKNEVLCCSTIPFKLDKVC